MDEQIPAKKNNFGLAILLVLMLLLFAAASAFLLLFVYNRFELEITVNGQQEITIDVGGVFAPAEASVSLVGTRFFREGIPLDVPVGVNNAVDTQIPGDYTVYYGASYRELMAAEHCVVHVVDRIAPVIELTYIPDSFTLPGEPYEEEGFTAWDDCDGDLTAYVVAEEKDGIVNYTVQDSSGNTASVSRQIHYYDPTPPDIILSGDTVMYLDAGVGYTESGWTAYDLIDGDVTGAVEVTGTVDKYLAGTYVLSYSVTDSHGNTATAERSVVVVPREIPKAVSPEGKVIYLTFDDGPGAYTEDLLKILGKYSVKATFFVCDTGYAHLFPDIVAGGHAIGIHTMTHDYKEVYASADAFFADLLAVQRMIYEETGVMTYLMRFPGGSSNTVSSFNPGIMTYLTQAVEDNGFAYFDWNVDSDDAGRAKTADEVYDNVIDGCKNKRIALVLQHDVREASIDAIERIIQWGLENGYEFRSLDMTSPRSHHGVNN